MANRPDYYAILGVPREASAEEIRKAYLRAVRRLHPDRNLAPGETELFLEVQQAYEVLSNPEKRAEYDASLPPPEVPRLPVKQRLLYSRRQVNRVDEAQLLYVLLDYSPQEGKDRDAAPPLNLCLTLDRSTSMKGMSMDMVKATAIQILRRMRPQDSIAIVAFSDRAEVIVPAATNAEVPKLEARVQMLQTFGGTEIYQGLEAALNEIMRAYDRTRVNHIILITDGRTYGDEAACFELAARAAEQGIGISGLGIGTEWNDEFLDKLAAQTGGSSFYVSQPGEIQRLLLEKFENLWQVYAEDVVMRFKTTPGVTLRYAFRLQPEAGLLTLESPMRLGPMLRDGHLTLLLEFLVEPEATREETTVLLEGEVEVTLYARPVPLVLPLRASRPVSANPGVDPPPQEIVQALSRLTLYRMQEQARLEITAGEYQRASRRLQLLASNLVASGETKLAQTVLLEAERLKHSKRLSSEGEKQIKYGTRALLQAELER